MVGAEGKSFIHYVRANDGWDLIRRRVNTQRAHTHTRSHIWCARATFPACQVDNRNRTRKEGMHHARQEEFRVQSHRCRRHHRRHTRSLSLIVPRNSSLRSSSFPPRHRVHAVVRPIPSCLSLRAPLASAYARGSRLAQWV